MNRTRALKGYLLVFGVLNILTSFAVPIWLGDMLLWSPRNLPTDLMVGSLYLAMGIIMIVSASAPRSHKAFIDFIVIANILHASIMLVFAQNISQVVVDSGFIGIMGVLPLVFYPWGIRNFLRYQDLTRE